MNNIRFLAVVIVSLFLSFRNALADTSYSEVLMGKDPGISEPISMLLLGIGMIAVAALQRKLAPNRSVK
jgi:hypothetical protein